MSFYLTHGDFYNSSVALMEFLNNTSSLDEMSAVHPFNLIQQHIALLTLLAQWLNPKKTFYLPKSYYDKHIMSLLDSQRAFKFVTSASVTTTAIAGKIQCLLDWLLFFLGSGSLQNGKLFLHLLFPCFSDVILIKTVEQDIAIAALLIAANFDVPNRSSGCLKNIR